MEAACARCHQVGSEIEGGFEGGGVGPDLAEIGDLRDRRYLLEAILFPNKAIAPGFDNVLISLDDGKVHAGLLKSESDTEIRLISPEDGPVTLKKTSIQSRQSGISPMPAHLRYVLSKSELRDLVEFLANLKSSN